LSLTLDRITYQLGNSKPWIFRARNILAHLLIIVIIYFGGLLLFRTPIVAIVAAAMFGLSPLANQPTVVADWVFTVPQFGMALAVLLTGLSLRQTRWSLVYLLGALISISISILMYDPAIVGFGMIYLAVGVWIFLNGPKSVKVSYWCVLIGFTLLYAVIWLAL